MELTIVSTRLILPHITKDPERNVAPIFDFPELHLHTTDSLAYSEIERLSMRRYQTLE
jgi:hypothetical protein